MAVMVEEAQVGVDVSLSLLPPTPAQTSIFCE